MPSLTGDQELTNQYNKLSLRIAEIKSVYVESFLDLGLCDSPSNRIGVPGLFGPDRKLAREQDRRTLLKDISKIMVEINKAQVALARENKNQRQDELDLILNAEFEYDYITSYGRTTDSAWCSTNKTTLTINEKPVKFGYILNTLMPKCVVLDQLDLLLVPVQTKLNNLTTIAKKDSKYENVTFVAEEVMTAAAKVRDQIVKAKSMLDGLKQAQETIAAVFTDNNKDIFNEHRGNPIVNTAMDLLKKLAGYVVSILTYPARLYDDKGTKAYVDSWFEKRQTESFKIFGAYNKGMKVALKIDESTENSHTDDSNYLNKY